MAFEWTEQKERAANLIAAGGTSRLQIAKELGVGRETLRNWTSTPEFSARVSQSVSTYREALLEQGVADRVQRVSRLHSTWLALQQIVQERSREAGMEMVPGGSTGLICVHQRTVIAEKKVVNTHSLDCALLRELRAIEKQAAQEVGQWGKKIKSEPTGQAVILGLFQNLSDNELDERLKAAEAREASSDL